MLKKINLFSNTPGGYTETIKIAVPLLFSQMAHAVNLFVDRAMLSHFSAKAVGASFFAGVIQFMFACFFIGMVMYTGTFVAQYFGAKRPSKIGESVWQGVWLAIISWIFLGALGLAAPWFLSLFKHEPAVQEMEVVYFRIISYGCVVFQLSLALASFWSGRGKTAFVMTISFIVTLCNVPFNYILIFGNTLSWFKFGWAPLGVAGAAYGTIASEFVGFLIYIISFLSPKVNKVYHSRKISFNIELLWRIVRFGFPNGVTMFLGTLTFQVFIIIMGAFGTLELISSGIAFGINSLAYNIGYAMGQASSVMTGKYVGAKDIPTARRGVRSASRCSLILCLMVGAMLFFYPDPLLNFFNSGSEITENMARFMLKFLGVTLVFNGQLMVLAFAVRAAGDTKVTMIVEVFLNCFLYALPCAALSYLYHFQIPVFGHKIPHSIALWGCWTMIIINSLNVYSFFIFRYCSGKWTKMRVIE